MIRAFSMVSMLVSIVLIGIMASIFLTGGFGLWQGDRMAERPDKVGQTVIGRSAAKARDVECRNNLTQLRMAIRMERDQEFVPQTLADVPGLGDSFKKCAIKPHEAYNYNPETGEVTCPHPGHEKY